MFRATKRDQPTLEDFTSNYKNRKPARGPEIDDPSEWAGLSMNTSPQPLIALMGRYGDRFGSAIAEVHIRQGDSIAWKQTGRAGHYTVWGKPEVLLSRVVRMQSISARK